MATRLDLAQARRVLDAGCGHGHWGRLLLPLMPRAKLVGVDFEPDWVALARRRAPPRATYRLGDVHALPFADASFDVVTCQTLLIHVADVPAVLAELARVLRPGGLLLAAEPNNLAGALCLGRERGGGLHEGLGLVAFQATCELGKRRLGEGDNSVGDLLPGLFADAGLEDVRAWASDRARVTLPGAPSPELVAELRDAVRRRHALWSRARTLRYWLAGGGKRRDFDAGWRAASHRLRAQLAAAERGEASAAGGGVHYLVAGRRRSSRGSG